MLYIFYFFIIWLSPETTNSMRKGNFIMFLAKFPALSKECLTLSKIFVKQMPEWNTKINKTESFLLFLLFLQTFSGPLICYPCFVCILPPWRGKSNIIHTYLTLQPKISYRTSILRTSVGVPSPGVRCNQGGHIILVLPTREASLRKDRGLLSQSMQFLQHGSRMNTTASP